MTDTTNFKLTPHLYQGITNRFDQYTAPEISRVLENNKHEKIYVFEDVFRNLFNLFELGLEYEENNIQIYRTNFKLYNIVQFEVRGHVRFTIMESRRTKK